MTKLRVWWVSQIGTDAIRIPVQSVKEAKKTMDLLSYFDCFQYNQHIRPDYCNTGGLEMYDEETQEWCDWVYDDRANLFVALRNTLVQLSPNSECRSEKHIFNYEY